MLPDRPGIVQRIDTRAVGMVVVALGGGRTRPQDAIDPAVGLTRLAEPGEAVGPGRPIGEVHARSEAEAERAAQALRSAYIIGDEPVAPRPPVLERLG